MSYSIFFDKDNATHRLPVNPEQMQTTTVQANEKYEILKLGQIVIPTHMELREYTFDTEFPHEAVHYVETPNQFKGPDFYLNLFRKWRTDLTQVRFIASNGIGDEINTLVLIEELTITEKAGEEGDKYVSFKLLEYREFGKKSEAIVQPGTTVATVKTAQPVPVVSPKSTGSYTVVKGDSLWAIAKKYYGDGAQYGKIYNANKDKIKNPSLIYPGQNLVIP